MAGGQIKAELKLFPPLKSSSDEASRKERELMSV